MYVKFFKRFLDIVLSAMSILLLSPILFALIIIGAIAMKGNPFFSQNRPGRIDKKTGKEQIITLLKFRTMTNAKDGNGNLLPDSERLIPYGRFLRSTSLDELPSLINIFIGQLSVVGPRPLLIEYLPWYSEEERHRHDVRPGLTGLAQVNGRNTITWEEKFAFDLQYIEKCSFVFDIKIILLTIKKVFKRSDILVGNDYKIGKFSVVRAKQIADSKEQSENESNR